MAMPKYVKGKDGKFTGSIGDGKTNIPTPAPAGYTSGFCAECDSKEDRLSDDGLCAGCFDTKEEAGYAEAWNRYQAQQQQAAPAAPELPYGPLHETRARMALTMGECHNLALAMHRATNWPLIAFSPWNADGPGTTGVLTHVAVLTPDGFVVDGHGINELSWAQDQGEHDGRVLKDENELTAWIAQDTEYGSGEWLPTRPDEFKGYVHILLREYQAGHKD